MGTNLSGFDDGGWALVPPPAARRSRRQHQGMRALTSLLFLFVFALGQASLIAVADEMEPEPIATETIATETTETSADGPATTPVEGEPAPEGGSVESSTDAVEAVDPAEDATAGALDEAADPTSAGTDAGTSAHTGNSGTAEVTEVTPDTPGPPSGDGVQPLLVLGNPDCLDVMASGTFLFEHKTGVPQDATIDLTFDGLSGTVQVEVNETAETFDFTFSGDFVAAGVIVKGGPNANFYDYRPDGNATDTGLHAPVNPANSKFYGLSHISFCIAEVTRAPGIDVEKTCPDSVAFGAEIEYTITVENSGDEPLVDVVVEDSLLGDITAEFDPDLSAGLAVGATATAVVTRTPGPEEDPVTNTVTAEGTGADSAVVDSDTATCETDVIATGPSIQIVKGGPALIHRGETITYQFEVTNDGNAELFDVELGDPRCDPDTIVPGVDVDESLAVDEVWGFTCTHLVTEGDPDPLPNTVTVRGDIQAGAGGQEVTAQASHEVDIIQPAITIVKTVSDSTVPIGTTVTYTFVVTNTGDTTLFDISVDDDILGHIGTISTLQAGASETLTATFTVGAQPVVNVGTASGQDILGRTVTDSDQALVSPVAGAGGGAPPGPGVGQGPPPEAGGVTGGTPFTGSEIWNWALLAAALALIGVTTLLAATRKGRRAEGSAG